MGCLMMRITLFEMGTHEAYAVIRCQDIFALVCFRTILSLLLQRLRITERIEVHLLDVPRKEESTMESKRRSCET